MTFLKLVQAEFLKTKRIPILGLYCALMLGSIGMVFTFFYFKTLEEFLNEIHHEENPNPWYAYYFQRYLFLWTVFLPLIVSIATYVVKNIEDKSDAWKRVFVLPYNRTIIHVSKLSVIWIYTTLYVLVSFIFLFLSGIALSKLKPDFNFSAHHTYHEFLLIFCFKFEIAALSITTFSYAYLILIRRTVVSLLLTIFLPFVSLLFKSPYSSPIHQRISFGIKRAEMIINSYPYETLQVQVIASPDIVCIGTIVLSFVAIVWASKRPIINYE